MGEHMGTCLLLVCSFSWIVPIVLISGTVVLSPNSLIIENSKILVTRSTFTLTELRLITFCTNVWCYVSSKSPQVLGSASQMKSQSYHVG